MSITHPSRLHYLCSAVCGGHSTEEELVELGRMLEADVAAQSMYVKYLDVHTALAELGPLKLHTAKSLGRAYAQKSSPATSTSQPLNWLYGLVAMVLVSLLTWHLTSRVNRGQAIGEVAQGQANLNVGQLSIDSGTLQVKLPGVGTLVADGPANMELETPMRLRVDRGRVKLRVTEDTGHGFVVATPHGDVTDLGTEFAVDVGDLNATNLVVFDGKVDLSIPRVSGEPIIQRLVGGEAVRFARTGQLDRIMSIFTGNVATFLPSNQTGLGVSPVIVNVSDILSSTDTKRFYEIVPGGFDEDKAAYVDRPYEWNGATKEGLPKYLVGGDYVRTFNDHKDKSIQLTVEVSRPCYLYVLWDQRVEAAAWLAAESFEKQEELVGLDECVNDYNTRTRDKELGIGPGNSIGQQFQIWRRTVERPGKIQLGSLGGEYKKSSMYGIVVVATDDTGFEAHHHRQDGSAFVALQ